MGRDEEHRLQVTAIPCVMVPACVFLYFLSPRIPLGSSLGSQAPPKHPTLLPVTSQTPPTQTLGVMPPGDPFHGIWMQERCLEPPNLPMPWDLSPVTWLGQPSLRVALG